MSNRVKQLLPERRFQTLGAMQNLPDHTPPFSYSTTEYNYAATDCGFECRRPRSTTVLGGVPYYGYRFYNPELGRWVSRDPIGEYDDLTIESIADPNLYMQCANNTISEFDYLGLYWGYEECRDFFYGWDQS